MTAPRIGGFFVSGGTMPLDSASYIERASDRSLYEGLLAGKYCYVLNSRQMGKSSLSVRVISKLEQAGVRTALVDLTRIGGRNVTPGQWYAGLCDAVGASLGLQEEMLDYYRQNQLLSPMQRFFAGIEHVAMTSIPGSIAIFIDEIDSTKNLSFQADEFFAGIRECFNRRVQDEAFYRLSFCLIGVAVPTDLISNPSTTPFNIGERIQLSDFTLEEMQVLGGALGTHGRTLIQRIHYWTGGQPFLSQSLCEATAADPEIQSATDVDTLVRTRLLERRARTTNINLADVGDRTLNSGDSEQDPDRFRGSLLATYERAWRGGFVPDDESNRLAVILKLAGLVKSDGHRLVVRNRIYREVFDRKWIEDNVPERELLRERQAFRRGILRAGSASAAVLAVVCGLGLFAWKSENDAISAKRMLDYELYVSDMNNMRLLEEIGDIARMDDILDQTRSSPYKGFEWSYWLGRIHDAPEEYTLDYSAPGKREEGLVSADGKQICLYDTLTGVVAVIDRKSRKPVAVRQVGRGARIVATRAGFSVILVESPNVRATRFSDGKDLSSISFKGPIDGTAVTRPRSDFALVLSRDPLDNKSRHLMLWDMVNGKTQYQLNSPDTLADALLAFSQDGSRVMFGRSLGPGHPTGAQHWMIRDTKRDIELDSFDVPPKTVFYDFSDSGKVILYSDPQHATLCRNVDNHKISFDLPWDGGDIPTTSLITTDDQAIAACYGNGRATLVNLNGGRPLNLGQHVWNLSTTENPNLLMAASTSVRIIDRGSASSGLSFGQGARITRDDKGGLCVFHERPPAISHYSDPGLKWAYDTIAPPNLRLGYPYNGRWRLTADKSNKDGSFTDVDGKEPAIKLSPIPVNYSCGNTRDSLVVLERLMKRLDGISGDTGSVKWTYQTGNEKVGGLWVSPNGDLALALVGDTQLLAIDVRTGKLKTTLRGHNVRISNVTFTRDGKGFFTCGVDGRVILWSISTLQMVQEYRGNAAQRVSSADLSPDGSRVATCNYTGSWQLWDAKSGIELMDIHGSTLPLRSVIFTSDGSAVITAGDDLQVRRWGTIAKDPSVKIPIPSEELKGISW